MWDMICNSEEVMDLEVVIALLVDMGSKLCVLPCGTARQLGTQNF
jgi:hypothetical protein